MGIYSTNNYEGINVLDIDSVKECAYDLGMPAAYGIMAENEANYNNILKAIGIAEYNVIEQTGSEMVYEAADVKGFFAKIKEFFKAILAKIAGLFKKFILLVNQYSQKDKDFVKKYGKDVLAAKSSNIKDIEFKGYEFTDNVSTWTPNDPDFKDENVKTLKDDLSKCLAAKDPDSFNCGVTIDDVNDIDFDETNNYYRGLALNTGDIDEEDFADELKKFFYGSTDKETLDITSGKPYLDIISKSEDDKKAAEKAYKKFETNINKVIKAYDDFEKKAAAVNVIGKDGKIDDAKSTAWSTAVKLANAMSRLSKANLNINNTVYSSQLKAIKDRNAQARAICVKILTFKPKKESAGFDHYTESGTFLDSVVLK